MEIDRKYYKDSRLFQQCAAPDCQYKTDDLFCNAHYSVINFFYELPNFLLDHEKWEGKWIEITRTIDSQHRYFNIHTEEVRFSKLYTELGPRPKWFK